MLTWLTFCNILPYSALAVDQNKREVIEMFRFIEFAGKMLADVERRFGFPLPGLDTRWKTASIGDEWWLAIDPDPTESVTMLRRSKWLLCSWNSAGNAFKIKLEFVTDNLINLPAVGESVLITWPDKFGSRWGQISDIAPPQQWRVWDGDNFREFAKARKVSVLVQIVGDPIPPLFADEHGSFYMKH